MDKLSAISIAERRGPIVYGRKYFEPSVDGPSTAEPQGIGSTQRAV
ncbi:MAG: hypothetical protein ABSA16_01660 [Thermoguttaceae bacterium]